MWSCLWRKIIFQSYWVNCLVTIITSKLQPIRSIKPSTWETLRGHLGKSKKNISTKKSLQRFGWNALHFWCNCCLIITLFMISTSRGAHTWNLLDVYRGKMDDCKSCEKAKPDVHFSNLIICICHLKLSNVGWINLPPESDQFVNQSLYP